MKTSLADWGIPSFGVVMAALLLWSWSRIEPAVPIELRTVGMDGSPVLAKADLETLTLVAGEPTVGSGTPSRVVGSWPGFRGSDRSGINSDRVKLSRSWPDNGPNKQWQIELCEGYASPAIHQGRVYVLDYDEANQSDVLRCLSLDDGQPIWSNGYHVAVTRNHGITRTVPVIAGDCVITMGPRCQVACWDLETGVNRWLMDLPSQYQTTVPRWYAGQCPLVDQGRLILACGGKSLMIALDCETGDVIWESDNPRGWEMSHSSITPIDHAGKRVYVYCGSGGIVGIDADNGQILWDTTQWPIQFAHAASPLHLGQGRLMVASGYDNRVGAMILQISPAGDSVQIETRLSPKQFNSEQQTPILFQDRIFGVRKRGGGPLVCMDLQGEEVWNSGRQRFGHGPYLIADGLIFVLSDHGELTMAVASAVGFQPLASHQIFTDGHDAWGPMAMVDGRLIIRDLTRMACLDLRAK